VHSFAPANVATSLVAGYHASKVEAR